MFSFRRTSAAGRTRIASLRQLYRRFSSEDTREARGLRLLLEWLSPEQRAQFEARGWFEVTGCESGKRYRIYRGRGTNVYELDELGRRRKGWCFVPFGYLAVGDVLLAQKIALETCEYAALAVANRFMPRDEPDHAGWVVYEDPTFRPPAEIRGQPPA